MGNNAENERENAWAWIDDEKTRAADADRLLREVYPGVFESRENIA